MTETSFPLPIQETAVPADGAAAAEVVRRAAETRTPIYPIGGATQLGLGGQAVQPGIALQLTGLNRVIDYPSDDLTITVEAGITLAELSRRLAEKRQRLPVDVPWADRATIGGAMAVNSFGPRSLACGTLRDHVLGLSAVDGRGMAFAAGGRVVKNAAGLNLCRLLTGSLGTLAVFTQVTLLVRPMPEASALVSCRLEAAADVETRLAALVGSQTRPTAIELRAGPTVEPGWQLLAGFEGAAVEVGWMTDRLLTEWSDSGTTRMVWGEDSRSLWEELTGFPADVRFGVLPDRVVPLMQRLLELDAHAELLAHAGGTVLARFSPHVAQGNLERLAAARSIAEGACGQMTVVRHPAGAALDRDAVFGPAGKAAFIARSIKQRFDPLGILNPDRM